MWDVKKASCDDKAISWTHGDTSTIINHLRNCEHQPQSVQEEAKVESVNRGSKKVLQMDPPDIIPNIQAPNPPPPNDTQGPQQYGAAYFPVQLINGPMIYPGSVSSGSSMKVNSWATSPYPDSFLLWRSGLWSSSVPAHLMNHNPLS